MHAQEDAAAEPLPAAAAPPAPPALAAPPPAAAAPPVPPALAAPTADAAPPPAAAALLPPLAAAVPSPAAAEAPTPVGVGVGAGSKSVDCVGLVLYGASAWTAGQRNWAVCPNFPSKTLSGTTKPAAESKHAPGSVEFRFSLAQPDTPKTKIEQQIKFFIGSVNP